jgi:hypothetical protein
MYSNLSQTGGNWYDPFGIERGPSEQGPSKAEDALGRYYGGNRYDTLRDLFGGHEDFTAAFDDWSGEEMEALLHGVLGPADQFSREFDDMSAEERSANFDDPNIAELVKMYANSGKEGADG